MITIVYIEDFLLGTRAMNDEHQQLWIILLVVFIGFIGSSIAYPILPPLFLHPVHGAIIPAGWHESARSIMLGVALAVYPLGVFIGSPILGSYSDHYGRKRVLMLSLTGSGVGYFFSALALHYQWLGVLLTSRFLAGLMEGNLAIVRAMAMDLSGISKFKSLGRINSVSAIGYVMGPLLGGFLSDSTLVSWFSYSFPFILAMLFAFAAVLLAGMKLVEKKADQPRHEISIMQRLNLIARFNYLFVQCPSLKGVIIISTLFTLSVDIFYEFGPVYLTGLWSMMPASIAVYNAALSFTLAVGAGWLPHLLSQYFAIDRVIATAMLLTAAAFGIMAIYPTPAMAFVLFALSGLSISTANTNLTIQVSNAADKSIQGEAMGAQLGLRMLGDAAICLLGGFVIISSVIWPMILSCLIGLMAVMFYMKKW